MYVLQHISNYAAAVLVSIKGYLCEFIYFFSQRLCESCAVLLSAKCTTGRQEKKQQHAAFVKRICICKVGLAQILEISNSWEAK